MGIMENIRWYVLNGNVRKKVCDESGVDMVGFRGA